jgi:hypothetical protein
MIKKTVTYEDFDGNTVTEDFYFNMTKAELMELEVSEKGGFAEKMQEIIAAEDGKQIISGFKQILLMSIGERTPKGGFRKSEEYTKDFESSAAFSDIFMELATDAQAGADFVKGIMPRDLAEQIPTEVVPLPGNDLVTQPEVITAPSMEDTPILQQVTYNEAVADLTDEQLRSMSQEELIAHLQSKNPNL